MDHLLEKEAVGFVQYTIALGAARQEAAAVPAPSVG
jgi:hypothetical protein